METAERHAREIQDIIDEHRVLSAHKEGAELLEVRAKCSRAIAEACARHVAENNTVPAAEPYQEEMTDAGGTRGLEPSDLPNGVIDEHGDYVGGTDLAGDRAKGTG